MEYFIVRLQKIFMSRIAYRRVLQMRVEPNRCNLLQVTHKCANSTVFFWMKHIFKYMSFLRSQGDDDNDNESYFKRGKIRR